MFDEERRADLLKELTGITSGFSDTFSSPDWGLKEWEVCLLSFGGRSLDHACLARRRYKAVTAKYRVEFLDFVDLLSLDLTEITRLFPSNLEPHWLRSTTGRGKRVPPSTWNELIQIVSSLRPNQAAEIGRLLQLRARSKERLIGVGAEQVALERDAIGVALDIFDPSAELRQQTLRGWAPPESGDLPPFLRGIQRAHLTEEQMLAHDTKFFPGAETIPHQIGATFKTADRTLSVFYFNRTSVERSLGIDLIYYNHQFAAYTLVQYKRMSKEKQHEDRPETWIFRPSGDRNFEKEMVRMQKFREENPDQWREDRSWREYRLNGDGFFFKFCPSITLQVLSPDLIRGYYLPREYAESLLRSEITKGSKGGRLLSFENIQRHLNNSDFTGLVQAGWIGTRDKSTSLISEIIQDALDKKKSVIFAKSSEGADNPLSSW